MGCQMKIFLKLLDTTEEFFSLKLRYEGETLVEFTHHP